MLEIQKVLCPFDFSEFSRNALHHAVGLCKWYRASLTLLHIHPLIAVPAGPPEVLPSLVLSSEERDRLLASLRDTVAGHVGDELETRIELAEGTPAREIVARAAADSTDLIVMGTHGASGFERLLLGSVTEKVLRKAPCPVLTVPRRAPDVGLVPPLFKRILCPVDFSDCSMRALEYATSLAQEADACLVVTHVFELEGSLPENWRETFTPRSIRDELVAVEKDRLDKLAHAVPGRVNEYCTVETVMTRGTPYREILKLAEEKKVDVIVIGIHGRNAADLLFFGSTVNHVVRQAACPVLTIRS